MRIFQIAVVSMTLSAACACCTGADDKAQPPEERIAMVSLAGQWGFRLDPQKAGIEGRWFAAPLPEKTRLPGSTDENGFGTKNTRKPDYKYLSRLVEYVGPAWYQQEIEIPAAWKGKRVTLFLERCHWETRVWVDDRPMGNQESLCTPHVYDLTAAATPGKRRLTIRVDNTLKYDMGPHSHSTSEETQTNWNGIVGRIELHATDPVWIDDVQVFPDVEGRKAKVRLAIGNATGKKLAGNVAVHATAAKTGKFGGMHHVPKQARAIEVAPGGGAVELQLNMDDLRFRKATVHHWDEFAPTLYDLTATVTAKADDKSYQDTRTTVFGMQDFRSDGKQFTLNGRTVFLRGTLECCIFPKTGYPPNDVESWLRIFRICRSYGLNHMRFHSWCPPEAAFAAADQMGFILQPELPWWSGHVGQKPPTDRFIEEELQRILRAYGNHPSFAMFCMGNEHRGKVAFLHRLVKQCKQQDPRRLYTSSTAWSFGPDDDYRVAFDKVRGLHGPSTDQHFKYQCPVPVVSHEIGQWTIYPKLDEIAKYTGVLRARNFELVRDDLARKGLLDQAAAFTEATGRLMVLLYKEEIEVLRRTPRHAGFQLLDLHDFPGQGTARVGVLDPFWDSKGLITPEAYRRFCGPVAPLLRMPKRTYTTDETFAAAVELSQYGPAAIRHAVPTWSIRDQQGREVAAGRLPGRELPTGELIPLGKIEVPLAKVAAPARLAVTVAIKGGTVAKEDVIANDWEIWVYPARPEGLEPKDVVVARAWDGPTRAALAAGKKVLLLPPKVKKGLPGSFTPVFWSPIWFSGGARTMSVLCDPKHPALAAFPTEMHTNWQWHDLLQRSRTMILDGAPPGLRPIVQVIDNFSRNHRLGNVFEARVGPGRLVVCSIDLSSDLDHRPAARQMLASLLAYMNSAAFQPRQALETDLVQGILGGP